MACLRRPVRCRLPEVGVDVCPGMKKAPTADIGTTTLLSAILKPKVSACLPVTRLVYAIAAIIA